MIRTLGVLFVIGVVSAYSARSIAATSDGTTWAMCSTCTTRSSFIAAGQAFYNSRPDAPPVMNLSVGNPETGKVYFMQIVGTVGRGIGTPVPESSMTRTSDGSVSVASTPVSTNITDSMMRMYAGKANAQVAEAYEQTAIEPTFQTVGVAYKNQFLFNLSSDATQDAVFASFESATDDGMARLSKLAWTQEESHNPGFSEALSKASDSMLAAWNALQGHGILVSIIFKNGDVATFEIAPDTDQLVYIKGTARDRNGNRLADYTPNVGGGYGGVDVTSNDTGATIYYVGGTKGIRCGFVNGTLSVCIVVAM